MNNLTDIAMILQNIGIGLAVLAVLIVLIRIAEAVLRHFARRHAANTDLDLIGRRAVVSHTIRPRKAGKIVCTDTDGVEIEAEATSDRSIKHGSPVVITAIDGGKLRVSPIDDSTAGTRP